MTEETFRVGFVPGVTPDKWLARWRDRMPRSLLRAFPVGLAEQRAVLDDGRAHMCFVRLPMDGEGLHLISLYGEQMVVLMPAEHLLTDFGEVTADDLVDESVVREDCSVETVAAGVGLAVVPESVARLHSRRDLVSRPLVDAEPSTVALAWPRALDDERTETFVGIVRGRTARSSRGRPPAVAHVKLRRARRRHP